MNVKEYQATLALFAEERDWEQFHSPKNLAMALAGEAGELLEIFQWLTEDQSRRIMESNDTKSKVEEEIADIAIYLIRLCDKLQIDLDKSISNKIEVNKKKYPVEFAKGNAKKYTQRQ